jgi:hypothetical protein
MCSKGFLWAARVIVVLVLAVATGALAQDSMPVHLSGIINDYTAATDSTAKLIGPWGVRGEWNVKLEGNSGMADFSAVLTMEHSDYWLATSPSARLDDPSSRSPHTHHITMTDATVTYDTSLCPANNPATTTGFVVTGMASVTGNGAAAPFQVTGGLSPLQVCITGGSEVQFSNITLVFSKPAAGHFGSQAIHGAVRNSKEFSHDDRY